MKTIKGDLIKLAEEGEFDIKFFEEYFGVKFINPPEKRPKIKEPKPKKKRTLLDIILGK
jgi:hypothetical protein